MRGLNVKLGIFTASAIALGGVVATLGGCESATNLDVTYGDASAALEAGSGPTADGTAPADGGDGSTAVDGSTPITPVLTGCPCDPTQGIGCCLPSAAKPFCTATTEACTDSKGTFLKCVGPDPTTESVCCWHGTGPGAVTALAGACTSGPVACTTDTDCAGSGETKCALASCFGGTIVIGACGSVAPACPQP
jgi:hypothetical protein